MEWILLVVLLLSLAKIDNTPWKILQSQDRHNQKVAALLSEIRDTRGPS